MKHFKKIFAVALACVMMLTVLTGCGKSVKDYQNELNGKLSAANIGVQMDDQMNKNAETVAKGINKGVWEAIKGNDDYDYEKLMNSIIKNAHLSDKTQWCVGVTGQGQNSNVGFEGAESTENPTDFFVKELKAYNEAHPDAKLTKVGVGLWRIPVYDVDVLILLAE